MPPSASTAAASLTCPSRSRKAALTPATPRISSRLPAGALSAKPSRTLAYSRSTRTCTPGNDAATASFMDASAALRSIPSSSCTMTPTSRAESRSTTSATSGACPSFEVSAVSRSPTGRDEAGVSSAGTGPARSGEATDAGPVNTSAHAPTNARRTAGFFIDISLLQLVSQTTTASVGAPTSQPPSTTLPEKTRLTIFRLLTKQLRRSEMSKGPDPETLGYDVPGSGPCCGGDQIT